MENLEYGEFGDMTALELYKEKAITELRLDAIKFMQDISHSAHPKREVARRVVSTITEYRKQEHLLANSASARKMQKRENDSFSQELREDTDSDNEKEAVTKKSKSSGDEDAHIKQMASEIVSESKESN